VIFISNRKNENELKAESGMRKQKARKAKSKSKSEKRKRGKRNALKAKIAEIEKCGSAESGVPP